MRDLRQYFIILMKQIMAYCDKREQKTEKRHYWNRNNVKAASEKRE